MDTRHCFEQHIDRIYRESARADAYVDSSAAEFGRWQTRARRKLQGLLNLDAHTRVPLRLSRKPHSETDTVVRERVSYRTLRGVEVPAWLLIPKGLTRPAPAVVCPPGHGGGMNQVMDEADGIYKQFALQLVRRGMVVLVPEHLGFGERMGEEGNTRRASHGYFYLALNLLGVSQMGVMIWDLMRAVDVLASLPEVDARRIGCYGLSLGGETTLLLSAVDTRIRAVGISGFLCSYKSSFLAEQHCGCGYSCGLVRHLEHVDIAALIAPRPLVVESAIRDPIFPVNVAKKTYRALRKLYGLLDARERIAQDVFEGGHEISGAVAYDWLVRWLEAVV